MARREEEDSRSRFQYKPREASTVKARAEQQGGMYDSAYKSQFKVWNPKEGDHIIRVLPPTWKKADHYGYDVWVRSGVGPDNQTYLALEKMSPEGKDPVAEAVAEARRKGASSPEKQKKLEEWCDGLKPYRRVLVWVIVRGQEKEGPQLYPMPWTLDRDLSSAMIDKRDGSILTVDDPENGYDLEFRRTGTKQQTKYVAAAVARRSSPLSDDPDQAQEWLDYIVENPVPTTLNFYSYDYIKKVFNAAAPVESETATDDDDGDAQIPKTRLGRRTPAEDEAPKRRAAVDDDDADLDAPPVKTKKTIAAADDDDDIPFEEPRKKPRPVADDDDDAPPPPKRRPPADDDVVEVRKKPRPAEDEDDAPPPKRRAVVADDEDDPPPRRKAAPPPDDDDAPPPKRRLAPPPEEDEPAPRRRPAPAADEDDAPPPRKRPRPAADEDAF